jgi:hypothetical protein
MSNSNIRESTSNSGLIATANEQTPLLAAPSTSYSSGSSGALVPSLTSDDSTAVSDDEADDLRPSLTNISNNTPLSIDTVIIPTGSESLRNDPKDEFGVKVVEEEAEDGGEFKFHGGITKKKFWIIFTGLILHGCCFSSSANKLYQVF